MLIGALPTTEILGPKDYFFNAGSLTCLNNTTTTKTFGTFVMPFDGSLVAELIVRGVWSGTSSNYIRARISPTSTPAPNRSSDHAWWPLGTWNNGTSPARGMIEVAAAWDAVPKGTTVTIVYSVLVGNQNTSTFTANSTMGFVHAFQT